MKKIKVFSVTLIISAVFVFLPGCYTVVWNPKYPFPSNNNNEDNTYYQDPFYGDYYYYYNVPWWAYITPPVSYTEYGSNKKQRTKDGNVIRNNDGGRSPKPTRDTNSGGLMPILTPGLPSRSSDSTSSNNRPLSKERDTNAQKSRTNDSNSTANSRQNNTKNEKQNLRNNDGNRNNSGRR